MKPFPAPSLLTALLLSLSLTGCLEFKEQTLAFHLDAQHDTLRIFQDYHGIFGAKGGEALNAEEQEQLESVLTTERTFFFTNFVYEINKKQVKDGLEKIHARRKAHATSEPNANAYTEEELKRVERLAELVMDNVHIRNGAFYLDPKRQLCATQMVTIRKWSEVLAAGNAALRDMLRHETQEDREMDAEEKAALLSRIAQLPAFLQLQHDRLTLTLPVTRSRYDSLTQDRTVDEDAAPSESLLAAFKRQGGTISYADHVMTLTIDLPARDRVPASITLPFSSGNYHDNVVAPLKAKDKLILDTYDVPKFRDEFLFAK